MSALPSPIRFRARVISGRARGRALKVPTLNLDLRDVPPELPEGLFAGRATIEGQTSPATIHNGPRPTFNDDRSCEVHVIDEDVASAPAMIEVEVTALLRGIETFPSAEALEEQMREDIRRARAILRA